MLDIGDGYGAAIVHCSADLVGHELHAHPVDDPRTSVHTGIWERTVDGDIVVVAVFAELLEGTYRLAHPHEPDRVTALTIRSAHVTELALG